MTLGEWIAIDDARRAEVRRRCAWMASRWGNISIDWIVDRDVACAACCGGVFTAARKLGLRQSTVIDVVTGWRP